MEKIIVKFIEKFLIKFLFYLYIYCNFDLILLYFV
jgi:hypothetical protein